MHVYINDTYMFLISGKAGSGSSVRKVPPQKRSPVDDVKVQNNIFACKKL